MEREGERIETTIRGLRTGIRDGELGRGEIGRIEGEEEMGRTN